MTLPLWKLSSRFTMPRERSNSYSPALGPSGRGKLRAELAGPHP